MLLLDNKHVLSLCKKPPRLAQSGSGRRRALGPVPRFPRPHSMARSRPTGDVMGTAHDVWGTALEGEVARCIDYCNGSVSSRQKRLTVRKRSTVEKRLPSPVSGETAAVIAYRADPLRRPPPLLYCG
jgi:hypothetical protein